MVGGAAGSCPLVPNCPSGLGLLWLVRTGPACDMCCVTSRITERGHGYKAGRSGDGSGIEGTEAGIETDIFRVVPALGTTDLVANG